MLWLIGIWLLIGLALGALANGARLRPAAWGQRGRLYLLAFGALVAVACGLLATWLTGIQFATVTVLWVTALLVAVFPRLEKFLFLALSKSAVDVAIWPHEHEEVWIAQGKVFDVFPYGYETHAQALPFRAVEAGERLLWIIVQPQQRKSCTEH
jgi:hypothetical protein